MPGGCHADSDEVDDDMIKVVSSATEVEIEIDR
jgi:hypothetical protein